MVPLRARVLLAHATLASLMDRHGIRALHIKGYAALPGAYAAGRTSSDVDLLVAPEDAPAAMAALTADGWDLVTDFSEGSIFTHAATFRHVQLGYVDLHRCFPGIGLPAKEAFERLWDGHVSRIRAGRALPILSMADQRLLIILHAARDVGRRRSDVSHIRATATADEWDALREAACSFGAIAAWVAATDEDLPDADPDEVRLYRAMNSGREGAELFAARWRHAGSLAGRLRLVRDTVRVNRAHLAMDLGRDVTHRDALKWQLRRLRQVGRWARARAARLLPGGKEG